MELGTRHNKLLVRVGLVTPKQRYKQAAKGRMAIIEFPSIKDAIEARKDFLDGLIMGYENASPAFGLDPAGNPDVLREYCSCKGCNERRAMTD